MKFGTISEKGKSQIVVKFDEEHACKLTELEKLANIDCGQSILELIKIIGFTHFGGETPLRSASKTVHPLTMLSSK